MTWRDVDPSLRDLLAGFLVRVSSTVVMVRTDPGLVIVEANEAFRKLFHGWPPESGTHLGECLSMPDGSPPVPDPLAFDRDPVVLDVRGPLVLGTGLRAFFFPFREHCVLVGERVLPATAEALDVLSATSNELAALNRELRHRYREKAAALQEQLELMRNAEALGSIGWWERDVSTGRDRWSGNLFRLLDYEPDAVAPGLEAWASALDPGERDAILAQVRQAMAEGVPFESEWRVPLPGGGERWLLMRAYPDLREDGSLARYHGLAIDITQRKLADRRLKMSEEMFNRAFNAAPVIMAITREEDGTLLEVNDRFCAVSGYAREACIGRTTRELGWVEPESRTRLLGMLPAGGRSEGVEMVVRSRTGEAIPVLANVEQVRMDGVRWLVTTAVDLRERRRLETERAAFEGQAQHLQRLETVGRLASGVAHDMNNVLAAISAMATVLRERDQRSGGDPRAADLILEAAERGTRLVRSLRDFSRRELQSGEALDLNRLVRQEAELLEHTVLKHIDIRVETAPCLPPVFGDPGAISMALMNLAINACDAMPLGGSLVLSTALVPSGLVEVAVADTGEGMAPEVLARAVEPFFTTKAYGRGTGLGLSQAFGMAKAHGGTLDIRSEPGRGTRVSLLFPPMADAPGQDPARPEAVPAPPASLHVLLVDDDPLVREAVAQMLRLDAFLVTVCASGQEALGLLQGEAYDLVVLDFNMPGLDGAQTLEGIRGLRPGLPVLLATGLTDDRVRHAFQGVPGLAHLQKPFSPAEFRACLRRLGF